MSGLGLGLGLVSHAKGIPPLYSASYVAADNTLLENYIPMFGPIMQPMSTGHLQIVGNQLKNVAAADSRYKTLTPLSTNDLHAVMNATVFSNQPVQIMLCTVDYSSNNIQFGINAGLGALASAIIGGVTTFYANGSAQFVSGQSHVFDVVTKGLAITFMIDGTIYYSGSYTTLPNSKNIGVRISGGSSSAISQFIVNGN